MRARAKVSCIQRLACQLHSASKGISHTKGIIDHSYSSIDDWSENDVIYKSSIYMTALYEELGKIGKKCEKVVKSEMHLSS